MKLTNTILVLALTSGAAWAQNGPVIIQGAKAKADAAQQTQHSSVKVVSAAMPQASKPTPVAKPAPAVPSKTPVAKPASQPVKVNVSQAKPSSAPAQPKRVAVKPVAKPIVVKAAPGAKKASAKPAKAKVVASKPSPEKASKAESVSVEKAPEPAKNEKSTRTITANGRRDPFISPVVSQSAVGSGCSSGKRCLSVGQINLKGVVRSETGMIAVVVNALDKAYFLRENDPVFDGYVLKITGDSIVFKETVQDKLGKPFTREVTKKINSSSV
jgi:Tfp pilus assembly protein PilP